MGPWGFFVVALDVAADVEIADGYQEVRAGVVVHGDYCAGLEFEYGGADGVFDEEDLLGAAGEGFEAAVFILRGIPWRGCVAEGGVFEDFDGYVAEGLIASNAHYVGEGGGGEAGVAVLEFDGDGRLVFDGVDDLGGAEGDGDVVVAVPVHLSFGIGENLDVEDADGLVFES